MRNFLVFTLDQASWKALKIYGNRDSYTPNIDRIAASGTVFESAYCPYPLCQPSRASLWSGVYSHRTRVWSNGREWPVTPLDSSFPALGETFRNAGYETRHFGKKHDGGSLRGFVCSEENEKPLPDEKREFPFNMDTYADAYTLDEAVSFLSSWKCDKPLMMVVEFINPHNICGWIGKNTGKHESPAYSVPLPSLPDNFLFSDILSRSPSAKYLCCTHVRQAQTVGWTEKNFREYLAAYYYYLSVADRYVGMIMKAAEKLENTTIVVLSDHGDNMAARGSVTKQSTLYEEVTRVPFLFSGYGIGKREKPVKGLCSIIDLFPTLCSLAGIKPPLHLDGMDISSALRGGELPERKYVTSEWFTEWGYTISPGRMIREGDVKYIRFLEDGSEELYFLDRDSGEKENVAFRKGNEKVLSHMRALLDEYIRETDDPFYSLPVKVDRKWRKHEPGYQNHRGLTAPEEGK